MIFHLLSFYLFQKSNDVLVPLAPLNQVSQLLQSRKSEKDVQSICELSTNLNTAQVLKVSSVPLLEMD